MLLCLFVGKKAAGGYFHRDRSGREWRPKVLTDWGSLSTYSYRNGDVDDAATATAPAALPGDPDELLHRSPKILRLATRYSPVPYFWLVGSPRLSRGKRVLRMRRLRGCSSLFVAHTGVIGVLWEWVWRMWRD